MPVLIVPLLIAWFLIGGLVGLFTKITLGYFSIGFLFVVLFSILILVRDQRNSVKVDCPKCKRETKVRGVSGKCFHCKTRIVVTNDGQVVEG